MIAAIGRAARLWLLALSLMMLTITASVWLRTSQGYRFEWNGIDPKSSEPSYALSLRQDDWSLSRFAPLTPPIALGDSSLPPRHRGMLLGIYWQQNWPRLIIMSRTPMLTYYVTGLTSRIRLPYWLLFSIGSIMPVWCGVRRVRELQRAH